MAAQAAIFFTPIIALLVSSTKNLPVVVGGRKGIR
jgi:hypothetical protein